MSGDQGVHFVRVEHAPGRRRRAWPPLIDVAWLLLLCAYLLAGVSSVPFQGEESTQLALAHSVLDAAGDPGSLLPGSVQEPENAAQRLINGQLNRVLVIPLWFAGGGRVADLPSAPGWDWHTSFAGNAAHGQWPAQRPLAVARLASAGFLAGSVLLLFGLARSVGGRVAAWVATAVYTMQPELLIDGRRALTEGSLLFFGMLTIRLAASIARALAAREAIPFARWQGLAVAAGLTLASQPGGGALWVMAAWCWVIGGLVVGRLRARRSARTAPRSPASAGSLSGQDAWMPPVVPIARPSAAVVSAGSASTASASAAGPRRDRPAAVLGALAASGLFAILSWSVISPAMWGWPPERIASFVQARHAAFTARAAGTSSMPSVLTRFGDVVTAPFGTAPQYDANAAFGARPSVVAAQVSSYAPSWWSGIRLDDVAWGLAGTAGALLAGFGLVALVLVAARSPSPEPLWWAQARPASGTRREDAVGVIAWLVVAVGVLVLLDPVPSQRDFAPVLPLACLLAGYGMSELAGGAVRYGLGMIRVSGGTAMPADPAAAK